GSPIDAESRPAPQEEDQGREGDHQEDAPANPLRRGITQELATEPQQPAGNGKLNDQSYRDVDERKSAKERRDAVLPDGGNGVEHSGHRRDDVDCAEQAG